MYHIVHRMLSDEIAGCSLYIYESFTIVDELLPSHRVRSRILHEPVTIVTVGRKNFVEENFVEENFAISFESKHFAVLIS